MADENGSQNLSKNPDPQVNRVSGDDITPSQEQQILPDRLPKSLIEWLAHLNRRYLALAQENTRATSVFGSRPDKRNRLVFPGEESHQI